VALEQVSTPFVFLSDIDFLPMPNLYTTLKKAVQSLKVATENKVRTFLFIDGVSGDHL
jgi:glycosyltransferase-like protein LARGE